MNSHWHYRALALLLALLSWYLVIGRERVDTWVQVKIETAGLADGLVLRGVPREYLDVLVHGPKGLVRKIEPGALVYTLDARKLVPGLNTIVIEPDAIPLSKLFDVTEIRPSKLELAVEKRMSKTVPVRMVYREGLKRDYKLSGHLEPTQVTVSGPESLVREMTDVSIQALGLPDDSSGQFETLANVVSPDQVEASPRVVKAQVTYQLNTREVAVDVPVRIIAHERSGVSVTPEVVLLRFKAPLSLLREGAWRGLVDAFVEIDPKAAPGRHEMTYRVTLPQGCELIQARPEKVAVLIK